MRIEAFQTGPLATNTYVVTSGRDCWVVDPGGGRAVADHLRAEDLVPVRILLTHGHGDHIAGAAALKAAFPASSLCCPAEDAALLSDAEANLSAPFGFPITAPQPDELVGPGDTITLGESGHDGTHAGSGNSSTWQVLDTSGHTAGGVSFYCAKAGVVLVGDALFAGSIGRTDLPGASTSRLIENVRRNLLSLPDQTRVLPGHGPATTIGAEKRSNPFVGG